MSKKVTKNNNPGQVIDEAESKEVITREEAGLAVTLVQRYRIEIEKKVKQLHILSGEIAQLKANEQIIMDLIQNMVEAAERDLDRQENVNRLKATSEAQDGTKTALKEKTSKGPTNSIDETLK